MNILFIGDIFGRPGRRAVFELLGPLVDRHKVDFVVANVDNAAGGKGITQKVALELLQTPIDLFTSGNHIWERDSILPHMDTHPILRPYNIEETLPGKGFVVAPSRGGIPVAVIHLQGRVFMEQKGKKASSPFTAAEKFLNEISGKAKIILVDIHAEASAEKQALAWFLDGRVSGVVGTHTHVQTSDERILPGGTGFITDLGMTGPHDSVIGLDVTIAIRRFLSEGNYKKFKVAQGGIRLEGVLLEVDESTGKARSIQRVREEITANSKLQIPSSK